MENENLAEDESLLVGDASVETELQQPAEETADEKAAKAQKAANDRIAAKHNELLQAKAWNQAVEDKYKQTEAELNKYRVQEQAVTVPPPPDPDAYYDDRAEYDRLVAARDEAITKKSQYHYQQQQQQQQQQLTQQQQQYVAQRQEQQLKADYAQKATELGVNHEELAKCEASLMTYDINRDLGLHLMQHEQGPLIVKHLGLNHELAEKITKMSAMDAAVYIAQEITPTLTQKENLPPPEKIISGSSPRVESQGKKGGYFY